MAKEPLWKAWLVSIPVGAGVLAACVLLVQFLHRTIGLDDGAGNWIAMLLAPMAMAGWMAFRTGRWEWATLMAGGTLYVGIGGFLVATWNEGMGYFLFGAPPLFLIVCASGSAIGVALAKKFKPAGTLLSPAAGSFPRPFPEDRARTNKFGLYGGLLGILFVMIQWWMDQGKGDLSSVPIYFFIYGVLPAFIVGVMAGGLVAKLRRSPASPSSL
jgi:Na+/proline symporter